MREYAKGADGAAAILNVKAQRRHRDRHERQPIATGRGGDGGTLEALMKVEGVNYYEIFFSS